MQRTKVQRPHFSWSDQIIQMQSRGGISQGRYAKQNPQSRGLMSAAGNFPKHIAPGGEVCQTTSHVWRVMLSPRPIWGIEPHRAYQVPQKTNQNWKSNQKTNPSP
jgi:hypothetical protein